MKRVLTLAIGLVLLLACVGTVAAEKNLLLNGGFEEPVLQEDIATYSGNELTGWTINTGDIDLIKDTFWQPSEGTQSIDLSGNNPGKISQTINTESGATYEIKFRLSGNSFTQGRKVLKVWWDGKEVNPTTGSLTFSPTGKTTYSDMGWTWVIISGLKATGPTTEIAFEQGETDYPACGVALDDISVVDPVTPTPEFPSIALPTVMLVGFMGIVLFIQKSKKE